MDDADVVVVWMLQPIFFLVPGAYLWELHPDLWGYCYGETMKSDLFPVTGGV